MLGWREDAHSPGREHATFWKAYMHPSKSRSVLINLVRAMIWSISRIKALLWTNRVGGRLLLWGPSPEQHHAPFHDPKSALRVTKLLRVYYKTEFPSWRARRWDNSIRGNDDDCWRYKWARLEGGVNLWSPRWRMVNADDSQPRQSTTSLAGISVRGFGAAIMVPWTIVATPPPFLKLVQSFQKSMYPATARSASTALRLPQDLEIII